MLQDVRDYTRVDVEMTEVDRSLARFADLIASVPPDVAVTVRDAGTRRTARSARAGRSAEGYEAWLRRIVDICAARGIPLWDFASYN